MSDPSCSDQAHADSDILHTDTEDNGHPSILVKKEAVAGGDLSGGGSSSKVHLASLTNSLGDGSRSAEGLARGISTLMTGVIKDFDMKAETASNSQDQLSHGLDRLTKELDILLEDAPIQFIVQQAARISGVRKRVSSMNLTLTSIQRRVDHMNRMLHLGTHRELGPLSPAGGKQMNSTLSG